MWGGITIDAATPADAGQVAAIYAHHVLHGVATFETEPPTPGEIGRRIAGVVEAGHPWLIARDASSEIVGYADAAPFHARAAYRFTCESSVYIRHDRLGRGIGGALLAELIPAAEASGFRQMIALITAHNSASIALHRRVGFIDAGRMSAVGRKHGRWIDVITMQRPLGPGGSTPPREEP
jgi:L-amino acid N-acyltransferase YncA